MKQNRTTLSAVVALSAALALAACSPPNEKATGTEHIDTATVGAKTPDLGDKTDKKADSATSETEDPTTSQDPTTSENVTEIEEIPADVQPGTADVAGAEFAAGTFN